MSSFPPSFLQPTDVERKIDENTPFTRIAKNGGGGDEEATTGDEGDRRHLMQAAQPKDPKEVGHRWC
jgi:hypothetical protein